MSTERGNGNTGRNVEHWSTGDAVLLLQVLALCCHHRGWAVSDELLGLDRLSRQEEEHYQSSLTASAAPLWQRRHHISFLLGFTSLRLHRRRLAKLLGQRPKSPVGALLHSLHPCSTLVPLAVTPSRVWTWCSLLPSNGCSLHARSVYHLERCSSSFGMKGAVWV